MLNKYRIEGDFAYIELQNGSYETKISLCDIEKAKSFKGNWFSNESTISHDRYVRGNSVNEKGKRIMLSLHRYIFDLDNPKLIVDHINHDTLNNTRDNLRIVTNAENLQNRKEYKGAYYNKRWNIWTSSIKINNKDTYLGSFKTEEEAKEAFFNAKRKYHNYFVEIQNIAN